MAGALLWQKERIESRASELQPLNVAITVWRRERLVSARPHAQPRASPGSLVFLPSLLAACAQADLCLCWASLVVPLERAQGQAWPYPDDLLGLLLGARPLQRRESPTLLGTSWHPRDGLHADAWTLHAHTFGHVDAMSPPRPHRFPGVLP